MHHLVLFHVWFQIESYKTELTNKDNEITGLKMRAETLHNQQSEHQHYINVLKDQIAAKEQQSSMFQADVSCTVVENCPKFWKSSGKKKAKLATDFP